MKGVRQNPAKWQSGKSGQLGSESKRSERASERSEVTRLKLTSKAKTCHACDIMTRSEPIRRSLVIICSTVHCSSVTRTGDDRSPEIACSTVLANTSRMKRLEETDGAVGGKSAIRGKPATDSEAENSRGKCLKSPLARQNPREQGAG